MEAIATYRDFRSLPTVVFPSGHLWVVNQPKNLLLVKVMTVNIKMNRTVRWLVRNIGTCTKRGKHNSSKKIWRVSAHGTSFCCLASHRSCTYNVGRNCQNIVDCCSYLSNKWHVIREGKQLCPCSRFWLEINIHYTHYTRNLQVQ